MPENKFYTLPAEISKCCLSLLSLHDLASLSLTSRTIQTIAFPILYRTVYLCLAPHIRKLSEMILVENNATVMRIELHLRHLVLDDRYVITEQDLGRSDALLDFQRAIPRLRHLESLHWHSCWLPENPGVFETFHQHCPTLHSLSLYISSPWFNFNGETYLRAMFGFRDMTNISLCFETLPVIGDKHAELPKTITDMIHASPNLESLKVDFRDHQISSLTWSPDQFLSDINATFSNLRVLHTLGVAKPDWQLFFEDPESSAFHAFLRRHPKLHAFSMGWIYESSWYNLDPKAMAELLPSLRQFEGPVFICRALASSTLAGQLESLSILDERWEDDDSMLVFAETAVEMPKLRSLSFGLQKDEMDSESLGNLLSLAPALTELAVWSVTSDFNELVDILKHAPNLQELTMHIDQMLYIVQAMGETSARALVCELALKFPKLRIVHDWSQPKLQRSWVIARYGEHQVHVSHVQSVREGPLKETYPMLSETLEE